MLQAIICISILNICIIGELKLLQNFFQSRIHEYNLFQTAHAALDPKQIITQQSNYKIIVRNNGVYAETKKPGKTIFLQK